jgi:hypothetical protein
MLHRCMRPLAALALATAAGPLMAGVVTLAGSLGDSTNAALVASDLSAAQFGDDLAMANNVALYALHVAVGGTVNFSSTGFVPGGIDPYFTLFSGTDQAGATFQASNYLHATTLGGDFSQDETLAAGDYTVAIAVFENMSFAENSGSGFLADGFTGLGGPVYFGNGSYRLDITLPGGGGGGGGGGTVPEPGSALLGLTAALAAAWAGRRRPQPQLSNGGR